MRLLYISELFLFFLKEIVKANVDVAKRVFQNTQKIHPAILKVPLCLQKDSSIMLLANMITLTPGTLSLGVSKDHQFMFVHIMHSENEAADIEAIKSGFERRIARSFE